MTGEAMVCGTGLYGNIIRPGDPDLNNGSITARGAVTGIAVTWTLPGDAHAVSYVKLYRSTVNNFDTALVIARPAGDYFFDNLDVQQDTTYFYWLVMVSVNGTEGEPIGPASAILRPTIEQLIERMEGMFSESQLNQDLRARINRITDLESSLDTETQERLFGQAIFSDLLATLQGQLQEVDTLIAQVRYEQANETNALAAQVDVMQAQFNGVAATILDEQAVIALADQAAAARIETLQVDLGTDLVSLQMWNEVMAGPDGLLAQYMVKTDVNGYVSGFGLYNDGVTSQFIVNVDQFAIGKAGEDSVFPFMIAKVDGVDTIALNARALIPDAHITNAMIQGVISSDNYDVWFNGWGIHPNGNAVFHDIFARGDIEASSIKTGVIEAKHIKGGGVSSLESNIRSGFQQPANTTSYRFSLRPTIPAGSTGKLLCMVNFQGSARDDNTNIGAVVIRVNPNGSRQYVLVAANSVLKDFTEGGSASFGADNVQPGTVFEFYSQNSWNQGYIVQGKIEANMLVTLL